MMVSSYIFSFLFTCLLSVNLYLLYCLLYSWGFHYYLLFLAAVYSRHLKICFLYRMLNPHLYLRSLRIRFHLGSRSSYLSTYERKTLIIKTEVQFKNIWSKLYCNYVCCYFTWCTDIQKHNVFLCNIEMLSAILRILLKFQSL